MFKTIRVKSLNLCFYFCRKNFPWEMIFCLFLKLIHLARRKRDFEVLRSLCVVCFPLGTVFARLMQRLVTDFKHRLFIELF